MLEEKDIGLRDEFNQVQFGAEFAEISKLARNIDDVSIDSARVELKELGGDDFDANIKSLTKDIDSMNRKGNQDELRQRKNNGQIRKAAGTGDSENNHRNKIGHRSDENEKIRQRIQQESITSNKDMMGRENEESESCYINQSEIQSQPSQTQSQSVVTTERSHFTSIEGPPKVYEEIMRQLEADIRKHIRIEH